MASAKKISELSAATPVITDKYVVEQADGIGYYSTGVFLPSYTVATLPTASTYPRRLIYVSDGTSNKRLAVSDGTNWRFPDGNVVS